MTSWPWMKDVPTALRDPPIAPVSATDDRPAVKDLIEDHRQNIYYCKQKLRKSPLYQPRKHDDLWILRYLMSHKNKVEPAVKAALDTLEFRHEHQLDERDIRFIAFGPELAKQHVKSEAFMKYCQEDTFKFGIPDPQRGVVGFINISGVDQHEVVKNLDESHWLPTFTMVAEWSHQWLDYITRTTGRLTKSIRIVDASELTLRDMNRECSRRDGQTMAIMEDCYPQMLQTLFICNGPKVIHTIWRTVRPIMPKRVVNKIDILAPARNAKERQKLLRYMSEDVLPARYGGKNETWPIEIPLPEIPVAAN